MPRMARLFPALLIAGLIWAAPQAHIRPSSGPHPTTLAPDVRLSQAQGVPGSGAGRSLAPYVPTPADVVERMLTLARVGPRDVVYDLGCGDGRIVIAAAQKFGARAVGVDIDAN